MVSYLVFLKKERTASSFDEWTSLNWKRLSFVTVQVVFFLLTPDSPDVHTAAGVTAVCLLPQFCPHLSAQSSGVSKCLWSLLLCAALFQHLIHHPDALFSTSTFSQTDTRTCQAGEGAAISTQQQGSQMFFELPFRLCFYSFLKVLFFSPFMLFFPSAALWAHCKNSIACHGFIPFLHGTETQTIKMFLYW